MVEYFCSEGIRRCGGGFCDGMSSEGEEGGGEADKEMHLCFSVYGGWPLEANGVATRFSRQVLRTPFVLVFLKIDIRYL